MTACLLLAGCGQTGALYLVAPASTLPQATTRMAPSAVPCTTAPTAASKVAAPASVTALLSPCPEQRVQP